MQRFLAVLVVVLLAAAGVGYLVLDRRHDAALEAEKAACRSELEAGQEHTSEVAASMARDLTQVLAVGIADEVGRGDVAALDAILAGTVRGDSLVEVIVIGPTGEVLSSTDLRWRGRTLDDAAGLKALAVREVTSLDRDPAGRLEVAAPVEVGGVRVATVRAFFAPAGT